MQEVKPGDLVLYAVVTREKGAKVSYYSCEAVGSVSDGLPYSSSGEPITGVRAIYRRNSATVADQPGRRLLARNKHDPDEKHRLHMELNKIYGPGELVTGFSCQGESACSLMTRRTPGTWMTHSTQ